MLEIFLSMTPPAVTQQEEKLGVRGGKPFVYRDARLKAAREQLRRALYPHRPEEPMEGAVRLVVKWCFPLNSCHKTDGEYKTTRPDTDNLQKMLKDVMTGLHFWKDDAQVASEITEKFYAKIPGIYIRAERL